MELKKVLRTGLQSVSLLPSEAIRGNRNEARRIEYTDDGIKLSLYKTLEDLAQMESLQDIRIHRWFPIETRKHCPGPIAFNRLRCLSVYLRSTNVGFLKHISCPPGLRLHLTVYCRTLKRKTMSSLLKRSSKVCGFLGPDQTREVIRTLELHHADEGFSRFRCWTVVVPYHELGCDGPSNPHLQIDFDGCERAKTPAVCSAITKALPLDELDTLSLSFSTRYFSKRDISVLESAFQMIKTTRVLLVRGWRECDLCAFLCNPQVIFPCLRELYPANMCKLPRDSGGIPLDFPNLSKLEERRRVLMMTIEIEIAS